MRASSTALAFGSHFAEGRGQLMAAFPYSRRWPSLTLPERDEGQFIRADPGYRCGWCGRLLEKALFCDFRDDRVHARPDPGHVPQILMDPQPDVATGQWFGRRQFNKIGRGGGKIA